MTPDKKTPENNNNNKRRLSESACEDYRVSVITISYDGPDRDGWMMARIAQVPRLTGRGQTTEEAYRDVIDQLSQRWNPTHGPQVKEVLDLLRTAQLPERG